MKKEWNIANWYSFLRKTICNKVNTVQIAKNTKVSTCQLSKYCEI